ncbi:hypothetical protein [Streptomyces sp. VRA16 Mangrove soil]|uniref:hypothetical protein n=1 Tax=Streptomyces sp. VRA16 Mangrove soil TaxID=2817434 RepID=UPI001A9D0F08|nr:hypothetical protein [Streptomyces sp. VRA16 Mangrove soil]MBO1332980.1 hypothetical protein [Streptomyces sp. VRA16 Mangrove soil]
MTGAELVATALATEAEAALTGTAHGPVHDLWASLRDALRGRLAEANRAHGGGGYGPRVLDAYLTDPDVWRTRLLRVLTSTGAHRDSGILAAARAVIRAERSADLTGGAHRTTPRA